MVDAGWCCWCSRRNSPLSAIHYKSLQSLRLTKAFPNGNWQWTCGHMEVANDRRWGACFLITLKLCISLFKCYVCRVLRLINSRLSLNLAFFSKLIIWFLFIHSFIFVSHQSESLIMLKMAAGDPVWHAFTWKHKSKRCSITDWHHRPEKIFMILFSMYDI